MVFYDEKNVRKYIVRLLLTMVFLAYLASAFFLIEGIHFDPTPKQLIAASEVDDRYKGTAIALTFDDGPDPTYTPLILDILREKQAHATFFFVGKEMLDHPELVRQAYREGHEIANHGFSHSPQVHQSERRIRYELLTTNRIIEDITGVPARFYRSPYLLDFEDAQDEFLSPKNFPEGHPVKTIDDLGFVSVSAYIDPQDWSIHHSGELLHRVLERVKNGNVLLLHDGGPQQEATVEALPHIIDELRAHDFSIVRLSHLAGMPPNDTLAASSRPLIIGSTLLSSTYRFLQDMFLFFFIFILLVSIIRLISILFIRYSPSPQKPVRYEGGVSVLIPAFNEAANIEGTVRSVAGSTHESIEIIIIDDGSEDATGRICQQLEAELSRPVRYLYKPNGGKASALNLGLLHARHEVVIAVDGDTFLHPDAVSYLSSYFTDPHVGAVAGKVVAVHERSWLGAFQDMEYTVSQNIEKAAFNTFFGSINVIPGAIGGWRRSAVMRSGGYSQDTSVEDQDLTLSIHAAGYKVVYDSRARAYTEVPVTLHSFLAQRFRWVYGTIQCLWKYKWHFADVRRPGLGFIILPYSLLFAAITPLMMPIIDLVLIYSIITGSWSVIGYGALAFILTDFLYHILGFIGEWRKLRYLPLVPFQRIFYRLVLSYLIYKSLLAAFDGRRVGWGTQLRAGTAAALFRRHIIGVG